MPFLTEAVQGDQAVYLSVFIAIMRYLGPALMVLLLVRCIWPLITFRREPEIWAWLILDDNTRLPVTHWESVIGTNKHSDIVIDEPSVSPNHAVLTRYDDGSWTVTDADSDAGVLVNGKKVQIHALEPEDVIRIGGVEMVLKPISKKQEQHIAQLRTKASSFFTSLANVLLLTVFQLLCGIVFMLSGDRETIAGVLMGFGGIMLCQWLLLLFYVCIRRTSFEVETIAFFLCTMGMAAIATVCPGEAMKQLIAMVLGLLIFLVIGWALRNLERVKQMRYLAAVAGVGFLLITLVFGEEINGAKNWLMIGSFSLQPSEFSKVCFVFIGASPMDRLMKKKNLIFFIAYSVMICGFLAIMNDFGTALIFFVAFLVIAYMRSGSVGTLALALTALGFAGVTAMRIAPHMLDRFATWGHIWEDTGGKGWQQATCMMCMASGGFFGLGPGQGWLDESTMFAADSDMVIATIGEEWGLITIVLIVLCLAALAFFAIRSASVGRSSFYTIASCTAASILLVQAILNALGTVDILPLTGVTFPFLSNGGSSMIASWGLLAFIKAADTRQNASFAVRLVKRGGEDIE